MTTPASPLPNSSAPGEYANAITPSDSTNLTIPARGIYVGKCGDISVVMAAAGNTVLLKGAMAGVVIPVRVSRINATGTTASDLVALY